MRHFRNLARMGSETLDVVTAVLLNPDAGITLVVRGVAEKAREDAELGPMVLGEGYEIRIPHC